MAAPCINDTCSITSLIDPVTRRLELNTRIDPTGGLVCNDGLGLAAQILGDPAAAAAIDTCFQQLGVTPAGELWSIPKRAKTQLRLGDVVNIPQAAGTADQSANSLAGESIVNPFTCEAEVLIVMQYRVGFTISQTAPAGDHGNPVVTDASVSGGSGGVMIPYGMQVECRTDGLSPSLSDFANAAHFMDVGGLVPVALNNSNRRQFAYAATRTRLVAGGSISLDARANHRLTTANEVHWFNVSTVNPDDAPTFAERGFTANAFAIVMPFNSEDA